MAQAQALIADSLQLSLVLCCLQRHQWLDPVTDIMSTNNLRNWKSRSQWYSHNKGKSWEGIGEEAYTSLKEAWVRESAVAWNPKDSTVTNRPPCGYRALW